MAIPSVKINVINNANILQEQATGTALFIGMADWGNVNTLETYTGASEINALYKSGNLVDAVNFGVIGGLKTIKVYRIAGTDKAKSTITLQGGSSVDSIKLDGKYYGTYGNNIQVKVEEVTTGHVKVIISDGLISEVFDNAGIGYATNQDIVDAINDSKKGSTLVDASLISNDNIVNVITATSLTGGNNGTTLDANDYLNVINSNIEEPYDFLLTPDFTTDGTQQTIATIMESRETNYDLQSIYFAGIEKDEDVTTTLNRTSTTNRGRLVIVTPGTVVYSGKTYSSNVASAPFAAGLAATKNLGDSLTRDSFGLDTYYNYSSGIKYYSTSQVENLESNGFFVVNRIGNYNGIIHGITKISNPTSSFSELSIRLATDYIKNNLLYILNPFVGKRNTDQKRSQIKSMVDNFLDSGVSNQYINSYASEVVDTSATKVNVNLNIVPVFPINTIEGTVTLSLSI